MNELSRRAFLVSGLAATASASAIADGTEMSQKERSQSVASAGGEMTQQKPETTTAYLPLETLIVRREGAVLFVRISAPPINLLGPELVRDLVTLIQRAEADETVQVLVFKSTNPDYFISHVDVTKITEYRAEAAKLVGEPSLALLFRYLSLSRLRRTHAYSGGSTENSSRDETRLPKPKRRTGALPLAGRS